MNEFKLSDTPLPLVEGGKGYKDLLTPELKAALKVWDEIVSPNKYQRTGKERETQLWAYGQLFADYLRGLGDTVDDTEPKTSLAG
jgi:hypothetical protein